MLERKIFRLTWGVEGSGGNAHSLGEWFKVCIKYRNKGKMGGFKGYYQRDWKLTIRMVNLLVKWTIYHFKQHIKTNIIFYTHFWVSGTFQLNLKSFLRHFVTVYDTWIHHCTPEMKEQSKQRSNLGEIAPKKEKMVQSKAMATVYWDSHEIIWMVYL